MTGDVAPARQGWRADIQGLRAVAILLVVAYHAGLPVPGGYGGVDLFFAISGFVIAGMLHRQLHSGSRVRPGPFLARRLTRLLPAAALAVTATLLASYAVEPPLGSQQLTAATGTGAAVFGANLVLLTRGQGYFDRGAQDNPLLHLWSLGVEEQYYVSLLVVVLVLVGFFRLRQAGRTAALAAGLLLSLAMFTAGALGDLHIAHWVPSQLAFFALPARAWELVAGMLAGRWAAGLSRPLPGGPLLAALGLALLAAGVTLAAPSVLLVSLLSVAGGLALLLAGHDRQALAQQVLSTRPALWLGDVSYSWYLWHWPIIIFAGLLFPLERRAALIAAAASLLPAWAALRWVETPLRQGFPRQLRPVALLTALCVAVPLLSSLALAEGSRQGWGSPRLAALVRDRAVTTLGRRLDCLAGGSPAGAPPARCTVRVPAARGTIVLAGDSHADSLSDGVVAAGGGLGFDVALRPARACPITWVGAFTNTQVRACAAYDRTVLSEVLATRPALVVLAHSGVAYEQVLRDRGYPYPAAQWAASLAATVQLLVAQGIPVLVVQDVPRLGARPQPCRFGALLPVDCSTPLTAVLARQGAVTAAETAALAGIRQVVRLDPTPVFCHAGACDAVHDGRLVYADNQHLNGYGSMLLEPLLRRAILAAIR